MAENYTPQPGDTLTWLGEPRPVYTRLQRIVSGPDDNGHMDVDITSYLGDTARVVCTVGEWRADVAHNTWRLDAPRVVETPAGGALAAAYADARRAVEALSVALAEYSVHHSTADDLTWKPLDAAFVWDDGDGEVSEDGLHQCRYATLPLDDPNMATAEAYRAWVAQGEARSRAEADAREVERVRSALGRLYGAAGLTALDALTRGGGL